MTEQTDWDEARTSEHVFDVSHAVHLQSISDLESAYESLGISIARTRIGHILRRARELDTLFESKAAGSIVVSPEDADALWEVDQMARIAPLLADRGVDSTIRTLAQSMLRDSVSRGTGKQNTPGRDAQTELVFASFCAKTSARLERRDPPDFLVDWEKQSIGVAVKRAKSRKKVYDNISKGAKQLSASGVTGVVWVDISHLVCPPGNSWKVHESAWPFDGIREHMLGSCRDLVTEARRYPSSQGIEALIMYAHYRVEYGHTSKLAQGSLEELYIAPFNTRRFPVLAEFVRRMTLPVGPARVRP